MQVVTGIWLALVGVLAAMAGLADIRRVRQLRKRGTKTWGMVVSAPASAGDRDGDLPRRNLVQYSLPDGRVIERLCPEPRKAKALRSGQQVLVWYDPSDPGDVLVFGRQARLSNRAFVATGAVLVTFGAVLAAVGH
ncbi:MAG TPA: DUF3592 domain-containing protein [Streptosporangiaceae bacterium]|nr:DUF3592 domain-containing protein [Streptosporangiaceae bacterium]